MITQKIKRSQWVVHLLSSSAPLPTLPPPSCLHFLSLPSTSCFLISSVSLSSPFLFLCPFIFLIFFFRLVPFSSLTCPSLSSNFYSLSIFFSFILPFSNPLSTTHSFFFTPFPITLFSFSNHFLLLLLPPFLQLCYPLPPCLSPSLLPPSPPLKLYA